MPAFNLAHRIQVVNANPNIDLDYGPYDDVTAACRAIAVDELRAIGKTVGVMTDGAIVEWWWKSGLSDEDLVLKGGGSGGGSGITTPIISDLKVGAINAGQLVQSPKNLQEFAELLLNTTFYPDFIYPSVTIGNSVGGGPVEVGAPLQLRVYLDYNFGEIRGAVANTFPNLWNANLKQDNLSGPVLNYVINNLSAGLNNSRTVNGYMPILGYNTFSGYVNYESGPQPLDSKGLSFGGGLTSGTTATVSTSFIASYKQFFGNVTNYPTTSDEIRNLEQNNFTDTNIFTGFISSIKYVLAIPAGRILNSIITSNFENITDKFKLSLTLTNVNDASGAAVHYKVYELLSDSPLNLNITINIT